MVNLSIVQVIFVALIALMSTIVMAQNVEQQHEFNRFPSNYVQVRERKAANQLRNMMRIGKRADPLVARSQPNILYEYNNNNNEIDYSHLFRPNGFF